MSEEPLLLQRAEERKTQQKSREQEAQYKIYTNTKFLLCCAGCAVSVSARDERTDGVSRPTTTVAKERTERAGSKNEEGIDSDCSVSALLLLLPPSANKNPDGGE